MTQNTAAQLGTANDQPQDHGRRAALRAGTIGAAAAFVGAGRAQAKTENAAKEVSDKTAFITGGARGIGLAAAEELAKAGANIVLFDIATADVPHVQYPLSDDADLAGAKAAVEAHGVRCMTYKGDVRDGAA